MGDIHPVDTPSLPGLLPCYKLGLQFATKGNESAADPLGVGAALHPASLPQAARCLGLARDGAREDDPVTGMKARIGRGIEPPQASQSFASRLVCARGCSVASFDLRNCSGVVRPARLT